MRYKVTIEASFTHQVEVEARNQTEAAAHASDALMDYLDLTLHRSKEFQYFHEYVLKEKIVSIVEVDQTPDAKQ